MNGKIKFILMFVAFVTVIAVVVGAVGDREQPEEEQQPDYKNYAYRVVEHILEDRTANPNVSFTKGDTAVSVNMGTYHIEHGIIMWYENGLHEVRYAVHVAYIDGEWIVGKVLIGDKDVYRNNDNMTLIGAM